MIDGRFVKLGPRRAGRTGTVVIEDTGAGRFPQLALVSCSLDVAGTSSPIPSTIRTVFALRSSGR
ncbi:hypothetical protein ACQ4WX_38480 [Streptomyces lasalocidi]